jgi:hypothetical protein
MPSPRLIAPLLVAVLFINVGIGSATDHPQDAIKLILQNNLATGKSKAVWVSKDPSPPLPATSPLVGGATLTVTGIAGPAATFLPAADWHTNFSGTVYKYVNKLAPGGSSAVKVVVLKSAVLKVVVKDSRLPLIEPAQGTVSVTLDVGDDRYCAVCSAPSVDEPGRYVAKACAAPASCPGATTSTTVESTTSTTEATTSTTVESTTSSTTTLATASTTTTTTLGAVRCCNVAGFACANVSADTAEADCSAIPLGSLAPDGQVCDGQTGACAPADTGFFNCCANVLGSGRCAEGDGDTSLCAGVGGTLHPSQSCQLDGQCGPGIGEPCPAPTMTRCCSIGSLVCVESHGNAEFAAQHDAECAARLGTVSAECSNCFTFVEVLSSDPRHGCCVFDQVADAPLTCSSQKVSYAAEVVTPSQAQQQCTGSGGVWSDAWCPGL